MSATSLYSAAADAAKSDASARHSSKEVAAPEQELGMARKGKNQMFQELASDPSPDGLSGKAVEEGSHLLGVAVVSVPAGLGHTGDVERQAACLGIPRTGTQDLRAHK